MIPHNDTSCSTLPLLEISTVKIDLKKNKILVDTIEIFLLGSLMV